GVAEVLRQLVGVVERLRKLILQPAFADIALIDMPKKGFQREYGSVGVLDHLAHLLTGRDKVFGYRSDILKTVGNGLSVLLVEHGIEVVGNSPQIPQQFGKIGPQL